MGEEDQPVGFRGAEVEGDGAHALGVPFWQGQVGFRGLKVDGVEGGNVFALEDHVTLELHLGVDNAGEAGELQADIVVLVHHLWKIYDGNDHQESCTITVLSRPFSKLISNVSVYEMICRCSNGK